MERFFNDLDGVFDELLKFDRKHFCYNRPFCDQHPFYEVQKEDRDILIVNVVGMEKDEVKVDMIKEGQIHYLTVDGERHNELIEEDKENPYNFHFKWSIDKDLIKDDIECKIKNGLLYITMFYKKPEKTNIKIKYDEE